MIFYHGTAYPNIQSAKDLDPSKSSRDSGLWLTDRYTQAECFASQKFESLDSPYGTEYDETGEEIEPEKKVIEAFIDESQCLIVDEAMVEEMGWEDHEEVYDYAKYLYKGVIFEESSFYEDGRTAMIIKSDIIYSPTL